MPKRILILGGTGEAQALARAAQQRFGEGISLIYSLAGRVAAPAELPGEIRIGGFGGADGLADYLRQNEIDLLIDATHPFAARISANARQACAASSVPRLVLHRPEWQEEPGDHWVMAEDFAQAANLLPRLGSRAFLTIGIQEVAAFAPCREVFFLIRSIEGPGPLPLARYDVVTGRGPFTLQDERALFARHGIDVIVTKASGGSATQAKLIAAREAALPILMIARPPPEPGERAQTLDEALAWLAGRV